MSHEGYEKEYIEEALTSWIAPLRTNVNEFERKIHWIQETLKVWILLIFLESI